MPRPKRLSTQPSEWHIPLEILQRLDNAEEAIEKLQNQNIELVTANDELKTEITKIQQLATSLQATVNEQTVQHQDSLNCIRQIINDTDTKIIVEAAIRETESKKFSAELEKSTQKRNLQTFEKSGNVDLPIPTFSGDSLNEHPKRFLKDLATYITHKKIAEDEKMIVIENSLRGKAAKWFLMIKDIAVNEETFKQLFLKHFFSEGKQWEIFIKCTEAGKRPIEKNFQEHFHYWMTELKFLDSPTINEEQAINLVTKHFPIAIQALYKRPNLKNS